MKNIYVGNLSFGAKEQTIRQLFEQYGTVDSVNVVTDRDTGQPRGFAFVQMANDEEALKAIAGINGKDVVGRTLAVNETRPKTDRPNSGSGGGGGGRRRDKRDRFGREPRKEPPKRQILT